MITIHGKDVPTELLELVDPQSTALLIIDMQNDCCAEGGSGHRAGADLSMYRDVVPGIARFAEACRTVSVPVITGEGPGPSTSTHLER